MSYTREERREIAAQIMRYRAWLMNRREQPPYQYYRPTLEDLHHRATTWQLQWLEVVAMDVLGLIDHDGHTMQLLKNKNPHATPAQTRKGPALEA